MSSFRREPNASHQGTANLMYNGLHPTNVTGTRMPSQQNMIPQGANVLANGPVNFPVQPGSTMAPGYQNTLAQPSQPNAMMYQNNKPTIGSTVKQNEAFAVNHQPGASPQQPMLGSNRLPGFQGTSQLSPNNPVVSNMYPVASQPGNSAHLRASPYMLGALEGNVSLSPMTSTSPATQPASQPQTFSPTQAAKPSASGTPGTSGQSEQPTTPTSSVHPVVAGRRRHYPKQVSPSIPTMSNSATSAAKTGFSPVSNASAMMTPQMQGDARPTQAGAMPYYQNRSDPNARSMGQSPTPMSGPMPNQDMNRMSNSFGRLTVEQTTSYPLNLLEQRAIVPPKPLEPPKAPLQQDLQKKNAITDIFRCTLNSIPQTSALLGKCKLPFGIHIHPFKESQSIPVISSSVITRCTSCRTYLNPFVTLVDQRRWQCNLCYRLNEIPEKLCFDHQTRAYIDPRRRPELTSASVEFVAPAEYMLRPPQPAVFLFAFDASFNAIETGYLHRVCKVLKENLDKVPGDARTLVGFMTFNSSVHFYSLKTSQPQMLIVSDLEDMFLPTPDGLLVNLKENKEVIMQLLDAIPDSFANYNDTSSATGATVQIARKLMQTTGGRVTVFQSCLPNVGPGKLSRRENVNMQGNSKESKALGPSTDFYKKIALECAGDQIAIDLFLLAGQYSDLATLSCASRYSSGCVYYYPEFHSAKNPDQVEKLENDFRRYLTRPIGFEAVMRVRCTKGLAIHTFHGNCFVRSTDLLSLPNVNPDHTFSMQITIEDSLTETNVASFQAALLYTTSKGERRIRVHTLAVPVTTKLSDIYSYADQQSIAGLLAKMGVDRTLMASLSDAREALMNACQDCLSVYRSDVVGDNSGKLVAPNNLRLLPLYILSLLKCDGFKLGSAVSLDARCFSMMQIKTLPLTELLVCVYPRLYQISDLADENVSRPLPILNCSAERYNRQAIYLLDAGKALYIFIGKNVSDWLVQQLLNIPSYTEIPENLHALPDIKTHLCQETRAMIEDIRDERTRYPELRIMKEESRARTLFIGNLMDDRSESVMSYQEFLVHLQKQLNK